MRRAGDEDGVQRVVLFVGVVAEDSRRGDVERAAFIDVVAVVVGNRRVIHRRDVDRHGGNVGVARSVVRAIRERVIACVGAIVHVCERAVGVEDE